MAHGDAKRRETHGHIYKGKESRRYGDTVPEATAMQYPKGKGNPKVWRYTTLTYGSTFSKK